MKNDKIIYIVYPETLKKISMNNLALSELLVNAMIESEKKNIKFNINQKLKVVECCDILKKSFIYIIEGK